MPVFEYKGIDAQGQAVSGTVFGSSLNAAAEDLSKRGYRVDHLGVAQITCDPIPADFNAPRPAAAEPTGEVKESAPPQAPPVDPLFAQRSYLATDVLGPLFQVPLSAQLFFFRQLATMLSAGVGMVQCLDTLSTQTSDVRLRGAIREMREHALAGRPLSFGMQRYPEIFSPVMLSLLRAGEEMGTLDQSLGLIARYTEQEIELRNLYRRVTIYPKLVIGASIVIVFGTNWILSALGKKGGLSSPLTEASTWIVLLPLIAFLFLFFRIGVRNPQVRKVYDEILQSFPYLGKTLHQLAMAKFGRAFGSLYAGGVPISKAVVLAADACGNEYLRGKMYPAAKEIEGGGSVAEAFAKTGAFSPIVLDMTRTGETTGRLDQMMAKLAEYYEDDAKTRSIQMGYVFGVVALLAVGVYVGYVVISFWSSYASGATQGM